MRSGHSSPSPPGRPGGPRRPCMRKKQQHARAILIHALQLVYVMFALTNITFWPVNLRE